MSFKEVVEIVGKIIDSAGIAIIVIGIVISTATYLRNNLFSKAKPQDPFRQFRKNLGHSVLLGLEVLIAADIIRTVAVSPTFYNLGALAILVLIRSFLSVSLDMEIEGRWPWKAGQQRQGIRQD